MGLFTNPVTFTVNTVARIFNFRAQLPDTKAISSEWYEPAAALSKAPKFIIKHTTAPVVNRSLCKFTCMMPIEDGTLKPVTVNLTLASHPQHTLVQLDECLEMSSAATANDTFRTNFIQRQI